MHSLKKTLRVIIAVLFCWLWIGTAFFFWLIDKESWAKHELQNWFNWLTFKDI